MAKPKPRTDLLPANPTLRDKARQAAYDAGDINRNILRAISHAQDHGETSIHWPTTSDEAPLTKDDIAWLKSLGYKVHGDQHAAGQSHKISWLKINGKWK